MAKLKLLTTATQFATAIASPYLSPSQITPDSAYSLFYVRLNSDEQKIFNSIMKDQAFATLFKNKLSNAIKNDPFTDAFNELKNFLSQQRDDAIIKLGIKLGKVPTVKQKENIYKDPTFLRALKTSLGNYQPKHSMFLITFKNNIENNLSAALKRFSIPNSRNMNIPKVNSDIIATLEKNQLLFTPFANKQQFVSAFNKEFAKIITPKMISDFFKAEINKMANAQKVKSVSQGINVLAIDKAIDSQKNAILKTLQQLIDQYKISNDPADTFSKIASINISTLSSPLTNTLNKLAKALKDVKPVTITNSKALNSISSLPLKTLFPKWDTIENGILSTVIRSRIKVTIIKQTLKSAQIRVNIVDSTGRNLISNGKPIEKIVTINLDGKIKEVIDLLKKMVALYPDPWNSKALENVKTINDLKNIFGDLQKIINKYKQWLTISVPTSSDFKNGTVLERVFNFKVTDNTDPTNFQRTTISLKAKIFKNNLNKALDEIERSINRQTPLEKNIKLGNQSSIADVEKIFENYPNGISNILNNYKDLGFKSAQVQKVNGTFQLTIELESKTLKKYGPNPSTASRVIVLKNIKSLTDEFIKKLNDLQQPPNSNKPYKSWKQLDLEKLKFIFPGLAHLIRDFRSHNGFVLPNLTGTLNPTTGRVTISANGKNISKKVKVSKFNNERDRFMSELFNKLSPSNKGMDDLLASANGKVLDRAALEKAFPSIAHELGTNFKFIKPSLKVVSTDPNSKTVQAELTVADKYDPTKKIVKRFPISWLKQGIVDQVHSKLIKGLDDAKSKISALAKSDPIVKKKIENKLKAFEKQIADMQKKWNQDLGPMPNPNNNQQLPTKAKPHTQFELKKYLEDEQKTANKLIKEVTSIKELAKKWEDVQKEIKKRTGGKIPEDVLKKLNNLPLKNVPHIGDILSRSTVFSKADKILLIVFGSISGVVSLALIGNLFNLKKVIKRSKTMAAMTEKGQKPKVKLLSPLSITAISVTLTILAIGATIWSLLTALL